jgi:hypothetical protein
MRRHLLFPGGSAPAAFVVGGATFNYLDGVTLISASDPYKNGHRRQHYKHCQPTTTPQWGSRTAQAAGLTVRVRLQRRAFPAIATTLPLLHGCWLILQREASCRSAAQGFPHCRDEQPTGNGYVNLARFLLLALHLLCIERRHALSYRWTTRSFLVLFSGGILNLLRIQRPGC